MLGMLSPSSRGALMTAAIMLYVGVIDEIFRKESQFQRFFFAGIYGSHCWLLFGTIVQNYEGKGVEENRVFDSHLLPRHCFWVSNFSWFLI